MVGYIYGPKILNKTRIVTIKIWRRALLLYGLAVGFTLFYTAWAALLSADYARQPNWSGGFIDLLVQSATLQFHFGWADFLARYAVFMVFAPLAVWLVAKHRGWIVVVVSTLVWLLWREIPGWQIFTAWQIVFMFGIIIGYYLPAIEKYVRGWKPSLRNTLWWFVVGLASLSYVAVVVRFSILPFFIPSIDDSMPTSIDRLFDRESVGLLRILTGILWFSGLFLLFRRFEDTVDRWTFGTLLLLGKNSLFVYSAEALVIFTIDVVFPAPASSSILLNTFVGIVGMTIVYFATRYKQFLNPSRYTSKNEATRV